MKKYNKAFTLIELLLVISIVALLATIVLVSTKGVRNRAKRAAGLNFSSQVHHALGAYAVGIWNFDGGSGTTANDSSGYGNNGTITGASWTAEGDTPSGDGYALQFDGVDDYVSMTKEINFSTNDFTISVWVKSNRLSAAILSTLTGGSQTGIMLYTSYWSGDYPSFSPGGWAANAPKAAGTTLLNDNQWHHVVGVKNDTTALIYIDGKLEGSDVGDNINLGNIAPWLGRMRAGQHLYDGLIDEVRIYEEALTAGQVRQLYVEGAKLHENNLAEEI